MRVLSLVALSIIFIFSSFNDATAKNVPENLADLVEGLTPAVVNISTTKKIKTRRGGSPFGGLGDMFPKGHPFEEFNDFFDQFGGMGGGRSRETQSLGSGFVVSAEGLVVTNHHVIDGADEITVTFENNKDYEAKLIGSDKKTDLALLKIKSEKDDFPYVKFGDSDESRVGDWVVVIGNPFGLGGTVTTGIISAKARDIQSGPFDDFIQTDAAINSGNSGGPMFNLDGDVIGINTAIFSTTGGNIGIGFAVPSSLAEPIIAQLEDDGDVERGWLGVKIQNITDDIAESLGLENEHGALVAEVAEDSPAEDAGVKVGDVILSFNGKDIDKMRRLPRLVAETEIGKKVPMEVLRDGSKKRLKVKVRKLEDGEIKEKAIDENGEDESLILGLSLEPITKEIRKKYRFSKDTKGLLVVGVARDSVAREYGIKRGDVIVEVNQKKVEDVSDVEEAIETAKKKGRKSLLFLISRGDDTMFQALPVENN